MQLKYTGKYNDLGTRNLVDCSIFLRSKKTKHIFMWKIETEQYFSAPIGKYLDFSEFDANYFVRFKLHEKKENIRTIINLLLAHCQCAVFSS